MSETKRNKERVDQAWNKLYDRLDADGLLLSDRQNRKRLSASMLWKWGAVAAIWVGIGVFLTTTYSKSGRAGGSSGFNYAGEHGAIYFGDHTRGWIYCLYGWGNLFAIS